MKSKAIISILSVWLYAPFAFATGFDFGNPAARAFVDKVLSQMTLNEKIGQMTLSLPEFLNSELSSFQDYHLGGMLIAANNEAPIGDNFATWKSGNNVGALDLDHWKRMTTEIKTHPVTVGTAVNNQYTIGLLLGTDAVHGDQHTAAVMIFPHNIGLGATHDPELVHQIAQWTAVDVRKSGFNWAYAPTVAIIHDYRWGRTYESFGSQPNWIHDFAKSYVDGAQQIDPATGQLKGMLTSTKHFIGDGNTNDGIDQGDVTVTDEQQFIDENIAGYLGAKEAFTGTVMLSYSQINEKPMSIYQHYIQTYLFPDFSGFTVSDYGAVAKVAEKYSANAIDTPNWCHPITGAPDWCTDPNNDSINMRYLQAIKDSVNAGLGMIMLSTYVRDDYSNIEDFQRYIRDNVQHQAISEEQINNAVRRILEVKYAMGLIKEGGNQIIPDDVIPPLPNIDEKTVALKAAEESLVLLKNNMPNTTDPLIPVDPRKIKHIILLGKASDTAGYLCGGWTVKWQGVTSDEYLGDASTILSGIKQVAPNAQIEKIDIQTDYYDRNDSFHPVSIPKQTDIDKLTHLFDTSPDGKPSDYQSDNTLIIATTAERPYAEFYGTISLNHPAYSSDIGNGDILQPTHPIIIGGDNDNTLAALQSLHDKHIAVPVVSVFIAGRPLMIDTLLSVSNAFLVAWLPGSEGGDAIAKAIFGQYAMGQESKTNTAGETTRANTLSVSWPKDIAQSESGKLFGFCNNPDPYFPKSDDSANPDIPRFNCGFGLKTELLPQNQGVQH